MKPKTFSKGIPLQSDPITFWAILDFLRDPGLLFSIGVIFLVLMVSWFLKLGLEKELIFSTVRGFFQLVLVGFVLLWIFSLKNNLVTIFVLLGMILLAGGIARKRGQGIPHAFWIVAGSLMVSTSLTLGVLILGRSIEPTMIYLIPLGGMIIGNSMNGAGLTLNRLKAEMELRKDEVLVFLSLGASAHQAVQNILREVIKASLIPPVDTMKALGVIFIPGMMAGLIIAGKSPLFAVRYQIIVMFMLLASAAITNLLVVLLGYRQFFSSYAQLKNL